MIPFCGVNQICAMWRARTLALSPRKKRRLHLIWQRQVVCLFIGDVTKLVAGDLASADSSRLLLKVIKFLCIKKPI